MRRSALILLMPLLAVDAASAQGLNSDVPMSEPHEARYWLTLERNLQGLVLSGQVPDTLTEQLVSTYAAAGFGADRVRSDRLSVVGTPQIPGLMPAAMATIDTLAELGEGRAELTAMAVRVTGRVATPEAAGQLTRDLGARLPPGIRLTTEFRVAEPTVVAANTVPTSYCADLMTRLASDQGIAFASGSAEIEGASLPAIDAIASLFDRCPEAEIEVAGFTDADGDADRNLALSQARADAVRLALVEQGIQIDRLDARGYGEAQPVADNGTPEGRALNRRIEFRALGPASPVAEEDAEDRG